MHVCVYDFLGDRIGVCIRGSLSVVFPQRMRLFVCVITNVCAKRIRLCSM